MTKSKVYFMDLRATPKENLYGKLERMLETAEFSKIFSKRDIGGGKTSFRRAG